MADKPHRGFNIANRENLFRHPLENGLSVPELGELAAPHIESFNALFDDAELSTLDINKRGLLYLAIKDIAEKVVFDGSRLPGKDGRPSRGRRMRSTYAYVDLYVHMLSCN